MDTDLTMQMTAARAIAPQGGAQNAIVKQTYETEQVQASAQATISPAPAPEGQGIAVDKTA